MCLIGYSSIVCASGGCGLWFVRCGQLLCHGIYIPQAVDSRASLDLLRIRKMSKPAYSLVIAMMMMMMMMMDNKIKIKKHT
jgi:hypothetical protein